MNRPNNSRVIRIEKALRNKPLFFANLLNDRNFFLTDFNLEECVVKISQILLFEKLGCDFTDFTDLYRFSSTKKDSYESTENLNEIFKL